MRSLLMAAAIAATATAAGAQPFAPVSDVVAYLGFSAPAPLLPLGPPASGSFVDFVACPARTAGGSWVATDRNGYLFSLAGAPVAPNRVVRITGTVASDLAWPVPGWPLTPVRVVAGPQPCISEGYLQYKAVDFTPYFGPPPIPVVEPTPLTRRSPRYVK